jgi:hypothetical protein
VIPRVKEMITEINVEYTKEIEDNVTRFYYYYIKPLRAVLAAVSGLIV